MKANQAGVKHQVSLPDISPVKCVMCGTKTTKPYGFLSHGKFCVCSKVCDEAHKEERRGQVQMVR